MRRFAAPFIKVKVGSPHTTFHVHENIISDASEFFAKALKKEWLEGRERTVELPEQNAESFNVYLNWLYCRRIYLNAEDEDGLASTTQVSRIVKAYALGDVLLDSDFKDAVSDAFVLQCTTFSKEKSTYYIPHAKSRTLVYESTCEGSKLRALLVHRVAQSNAKFLSDEDHYTFLLDLAKYQMDCNERNSTEATLAAASECAFHEHQPGQENCYRIKYAQAVMHTL